MPALLLASPAGAFVAPAARAQEPAPVAEATAANPVQVDAQPDGVYLRLDTGFAAAGALSVLVDLLPTQRYQGYDLPMQVIPLQFPGPEAASLPQIRALESVDLPAGAVAPGAPLVPPVLLEEGETLTLPPETVALPTAPLFVLRSGWMGDAYTVVVAVSPIYQENGVLKQAVRLEALLPGAAPVGPTPRHSDQFPFVEGEEAEMAAAAEAAPAALDEAQAGMVRVTSLDTVKIVVSAMGIQRVPAAAIQPLLAGVALDASSPLLLTYKGAPVPLRILGSGANFSILFYAPTVGDRWNSTSTYLLRVNGPSSSPLMGTRALTAPAANASTVALDRGIWRNNRVHDPLHAGVDGDHYFAASLYTRNSSSAPALLTAGLTADTSADNGTIEPPNTLPLAAGANAATLVVSSNTLDSIARGGFPLRLTSQGGVAPGAVESTLIVPLENLVDGTPYSHTVSLKGSNPTTLTVTLPPGPTARTLLLEEIRYQRYATLALGNRGAQFAALPNVTSYAWSGLPAPLGAPVLFDVTDPLQPVALTGATAAGFGDTLTERTYIVAGEGLLHTPAVQPHQPVKAPSALPSAAALYILPDPSFVGALQPLVAVRQNTQKIKVSLVDVHGIYDRYGGGNVSPEAIRTFLIEADKVWRNPSLLSVVLVGDGSWDPKNYERRRNAPNLIPPYMHDEIDPYHGDTACDRCYGQLDGDDPHTGDDPDTPPGVYPEVFNPELWVGRFPVKNVDQLTQVVNKIVAYEKGSGGAGTWRSSAVFMADNYLRPRNADTVCGPADWLKGTDAFNKVCVDQAGDHAVEGDHAYATYWAARSPALAGLAQRTYYDPFPQYQNTDSKFGVVYPNGLAARQSWRSSDPKVVHNRLIDALQRGTALMVYNGHAHHYAMGATEGGANRGALLEMVEAEKLGNRARLFFQLSMTCLTAQFAKPVDDGDTLDERFFLHSNGGAVAVWGSTGYSLVAGHRDLQEGFFQALFEAKGKPLFLGDLLDAGYLYHLRFTTSGTDALRTFVLLGDPLTRLRFTPEGVEGVYLPTVANR